MLSDRLIPHGQLLVVEGRSIKLRFNLTKIHHRDPKSYSEMREHFLAIALVVLIPQADAILPSNWFVIRKLYFVWTTGVSFHITQTPSNPPVPKPTISVVILPISILTITLYPPLHAAYDVPCASKLLYKGFQRPPLDIVFRNTRVSYWDLTIGARVTYYTLASNRRAAYTTGVSCM